MNFELCKKCCGAKKFVVCAFSKYSREVHAKNFPCKVLLYDCVEIYDKNDNMVCLALFNSQDSLLGLFDFSGAKKQLDEDNFEKLSINLDTIDDHAIDKELYRINFVSDRDDSCNKCPYKAEHDLCDWYSTGSN